MIKNTREQYSLEYYSQTRWTTVSQLAKKYLSNPTRDRSRITEGEAGPISVPVSPKRNGSANRKSKFTEEIRSGKGTARDPRGIAHVVSISRSDSWNRPWGAHTAPPILARPI